MTVASAPVSTMAETSTVPTRIGIVRLPDGPIVVRLASLGLLTKSLTIIGWVRPQNSSVGQVGDIF